MHSFLQQPCPDCGGRWAFDDASKIAVCQKCGKKLEGYVIPEEEKLYVADSLRKQGAFDYAEMVYSSMLVKDPNDFRALNGHMLCKHKLTVLTNLSGQLVKGTYEASDNSFAPYKNNCKAEHRAYFDTAEKMISMGNDYVKLTQQSKSKETKINSIQAQIQKNQYEAEEYESQYRKHRNGNPLAEFILDVNGVQRSTKPYVPFSVTLIFAIFTLFMLAVYILVAVKFEELRHNIQTFVVEGISMIFLIGMTIYLYRRDKKIYDVLHPNKKLKIDLAQEIESKKAIDTERETILDTIKKLTWEVKKVTPKDI